MSLLNLALAQTSFSGDKWHALAEMGDSCDYAVGYTMSDGSVTGEGVVSEGNSARSRMYRSVLSIGVEILLTR